VKQITSLIFLIFCVSGQVLANEPLDTLASIVILLHVKIDDIDVEVTKKIECSPIKLCELLILPQFTLLLSSQNKKLTIVISSNNADEFVFNNERRSFLIVGMKHIPAIEIYSGPENYNLKYVVRNHVGTIHLKVIDNKR
jgi:hypothetical protein